MGLLRCLLTVTRKINFDNWIFSSGQKTLGRNLGATWQILTTVSNKKLEGKTHTYKRLECNLDMNALAMTMLQMTRVNKNNMITKIKTPGIKKEKP